VKRKVTEDRAELEEARERTVPEPLSEILPEIVEGTEAGPEAPYEEGE